MGSTQENITISENISVNLVEPTNKSSMIPLMSFELLNQYRSKVKRSRGKPGVSNNSCGTPVLTTTTLVKLAKEQLSQSKPVKVEDICNAASSFGSQSGFSSKDFELAMLIQAAAEKVANGKYVQASKLLSRCDEYSCKTGTPLQRLVYYFSQALQMKIDREWGSSLAYQLKPAEVRKLPIDVEQAQYHLNPAIMAGQQEEPFGVVIHFIGSQTILDYVASAKKVHLIDFGINNGSHWTPLMQSLATRSNEYPVEQLKITAVGSSREILEGIGKWLVAFADTVELPFVFNIVVSDLKDIKEDLFQLETDETVAVYLGLRLWSLLTWPNDLQRVIKVIKNFKPCVVVVKELEASTNSPNFLERFNEALLLYSVMFDCINASMSHQILYRKLTEEVNFRDKIVNTITAEGAERIFRYEKIAFWRSLFARFGIVETGLSSASLSMATWLLMRSPRLIPSTLEMDGKCLIMGWKRRPIMSLSAWNFLPER